MADKTANTTPQTTNVPRMLWFAAAACAFNSGLIALWLTCFAILSSRVTTLAPVIVGVLTPVAAGHILLDCSIVCTAIRTAKPGCRRTKEVTTRTRNRALGARHHYGQSWFSGSRIR